MAVVILIGLEVTAVVLALLDFDVVAQAVVVVSVAVARVVFAGLL